MESFGGPACAAKRLGRPAVLAVCFTVLFGGCAALPEESGPALLLDIGPVASEALDQFRVRFSFSAVLRNPQRRPVSVGSAEAALRLEDREAGRADLGGDFLLAPGESRTMPGEVVIDLRDGREGGERAENRGDPPWNLEIRVRGGPDGGALLAAARAEGVCPVVREPVLTIRSVILVKYELVNVLMELVLDVRNPNRFPVEFSSASYRFYGEGRLWSNGSAERAVTIPAGETAEVRLPVVLNFTEMGRGVFDLVAKLRTVRYRLEGEARVSTPSAFLPEFRMRFDRAGAVQVERSLGEPGT